MDTSSMSYSVKRTEIFLGKELKFGEPAGNTFVRLSQQKNGWKRPVHETWDVQGKVQILENPLEHHSGKTVSQFITKLNKYSTQNAEYLYTQGERASWYHILLYPLGKFLYNYVIKQGFRDGTHGFLHALFMSFHTFLTRGKLWQLNTSKSPQPS